MSVFGGTSVSGAESNLSGVAGQAQDISSQLAALSPILFGQGQNDIYPTGLSQFQAGASGQLTPAQQAAVDQTLQQMNLGTEGTYGNLGLGGSTMESQDLNANKQKSLAQEQGFNVQSEMLGMDALKTALGFETGGVSALTGAASALSPAVSAFGDVGQLAAGQQAAQMQALSNLGGGLGGKVGAGLF